MKKRKLIPLSLLKKLTWKLCSLALRLDNADNQGYCTCITCNKSILYSGTGLLQAGHFVTRGKLSTRFHPQNLAPQCGYCNGPGNGQQYLFGLAIDLKYGTGTAMSIIEQSKVKRDFKRVDYNKLIKDYLTIINKNTKEKSLITWQKSFAKYEVKWILGETSCYKEFRLD